MQQQKPRRPPSQRVTLKAVAEAANVSPITVSNVVNGRFRSMSEDTRARVEAAIARLNYRVNLAARSLKHSQHYTVALIVVDQRPAFLAHPAHHQVAAGLSNYLNANGYAAVIEGVSPDRVEDVSFLDRVSADALCLIASGSLADRREMLERLQAAGQPLVVIHEPPMGSSARTCHVRSDDCTGGKLLAKHMLARGARQALLLLPRRDWASMDEREKGVKSVFRRVKGASLQTVRVEGLSVEEVGNALHEVLSRGVMPDAVLAGNDLLAAAAQKYFTQQGYKVPAQVRIGGFGGYDLVQYLNPTITSIRIPSYAMGQAAGQALLQAITTGRFAQGDVLLPVELVLGEST